MNIKSTEIIVFRYVFDARLHTPRHDILMFREMLAVSFNGMEQKFYTRLHASFESFTIITNMMLMVRCKINVHISTNKITAFDIYAMQIHTVYHVTCNIYHQHFIFL